MMLSARPGARSRADRERGYSNRSKLASRSWSSTSNWDSSHWTGDYSRAGAPLAEGLALWRDLADTYGMAQLVGELAAVACAQGQPERAARLFGPPTPNVRS
jgi:hypothetical protein